MAKKKKLFVSIAKSREVKTPTRGTSFSAGLDLYIPKFTTEYIKKIKELNPTVNVTSNRIYLSPGQRILLPSGLYFSIPKNKVLIINNKSGVSSKLGLDVLACVIDADYMGEVHINLVNTSKHEVVELVPDQKIVQALLFDTYYFDINEKDSVHELTWEAYSKEPDVIVRGTGGFGSTDEHTNKNRKKEE